MYCADVSTTVGSISLGKFYNHIVWNGCQQVRERSRRVPATVSQAWTPTVPISQRYFGSSASQVQKISCELRIHMWTEDKLGGSKGQFTSHGDSMWWQWETESKSRQVFRRAAWGALWDWWSIQEEIISIEVKQGSQKYMTDKELEEVGAFLSWSTPQLRPRSEFLLI